MRPSHPYCLAARVNWKLCRVALRALSRQATASGLPLTLDQTEPAEINTFPHASLSKSRSEDRGASFGLLPCCLHVLLAQRVQAIVSSSACVPLAWPDWPPLWLPWALP